MGLALWQVFYLAHSDWCWHFFSVGKKCPYCRSSIHRDAVKCLKCQSDLSEKFANPGTLLSISANGYKSSSKMKVALLWVILVIFIVAIPIMNLN